MSDSATPEQIGGWLAAIAGAAVVLRKAAQKISGTDEPSWAREMIDTVKENTGAIQQLRVEMSEIKGRLR